jgi:hypothetical protein
MSMATAPDSVDFDDILDRDFGEDDSGGGAPESGGDEDGNEGGGSFPVDEDGEGSGDDDSAGLFSPPDESEPGGDSSYDYRAELAARDQQLADMRSQISQLTGSLSQMNQMFQQLPSMLKQDKPEPEPEDPYKDLDLNDPYDVATKANMEAERVRRELDELKRQMSDREETQRKSQHQQALQQWARTTMENGLKHYESQFARKFGGKVPQVVREAAWSAAKDAFYQHGYTQEAGNHAIRLIHSIFERSASELGGRFAPPPPPSSGGKDRSRTGMKRRSSARGAPGSGSRGLRPSKPVEKMSKEEFDREVDNYLDKVFGED